MASSGIFSTLRGAAEPALKKLRNRLLAVNLISLSLVVAISFSIIYLNFYNRTQSTIEETFSKIPRSVLENVILSQRETGPIISGTTAPDENTITISGIPQIPVDYSKSFVVNIMDDGSITAFSILDMDNKTYLMAIETALEGSMPKGDVSIAGRTWRYSVEQNGRVLQPGNLSLYKYSIVFLDIEDMNRGLGSLAASLFVIGAVAVAVILLISLLVANRAIQPVEESMARQKRFVADASHELKTPIAVIAANAEAAAGAAGLADNMNMETNRNTTETVEISCWVGNIADEANRMGDLVENLLALARAEEKQTERIPFDLAGAVREEADRVEAFLFEKGVAFDFQLLTPENAPLTIRSDRTKVQAALSILLENAIKYTPEGGQVTITAGKCARNGNRGAKPAVGVYVSVANTGAYITPEDLSQIFNCFSGRTLRATA